MSFAPLQAANPAPVFFNFSAWEDFGEDDSGSGTGGSFAILQTGGGPADRINEAGNAGQIIQSGH